MVFITSAVRLVPAEEGWRLFSMSPAQIIPGSEGSGGHYPERRVVLSCPLLNLSLNEGSRKPKTALRCVPEIKVTFITSPAQLVPGGEGA